MIKNKIITGLSYLNTAWKRKLINISKTFGGKYGLEIGGPSPSVFSLKTIFPVYVFAKKIDGVNFSNNTVWEGRIEEGVNYKYFQNKTGFQYIREATDLIDVPDEKYDFVLSSHNLEHIANPIKALMEWYRVLKINGQLVLILPDKRKTFDFNRPYTTFQHMLEDYENKVDENDQTHLHEILHLHDFSFEPSSNKTLLNDRLQKNLLYRVAHHHVFSMDVIKEMLTYVGFTVTYQQTCTPFNLVTIAEKKATLT